VIGSPFAVWSFTIENAEGTEKIPVLPRESPGMAALASRGTRPPKPND
jgi:hypothetical protein